ncbi:MAG: hypothetical protein CSA86_03365 [Arcobacter sp.]|nr:MAG: hypothetical protein CSA86_03365 [Arcobacter sp.]
MKNIQYIIIFTLLLALGILYIQFMNYKNISSTLLNENTRNTAQISQLNSKISSLIIQNKELKTKISVLKKELDHYKSPINTILPEKEPVIPNESIDMHKLYLKTSLDEKVEKDYSNQNFTNNIAPYKKEVEKEDEKVNSSSLMPSIDIDIEKEEITGVGIQYEQKF